MRNRLLLFVLLASGCGGLFSGARSSEGAGNDSESEAGSSAPPNPPDAGQTPEPDGGVSQIPDAGIRTPDGGASADAGESVDGGDGGDAGVTVVPPRYRFEAIQPKPSSPQLIHGVLLPNGSLLVAMSSGRLKAYKSGTWSNVATLEGFTWTEGIHLTKDGRVYVLFYQGLVRCEADCDLSSAKYVRIASDLNSMCSGGDEPAFLRLTGGAARLLRVVSGALVESSVALPLQANACRVLSDSEVLVSVQGTESKVLRVTDTGVTEEKLANGDPVRAVYRFSPSNPVAATGFGDSILLRSPDGSWKVVGAGGQPDVLYRALVNLPEGGLLAGGTELTGQLLWSRASELGRVSVGVSVDIMDLVVGSGGEVYVLGREHDSGGRDTGILLKGTPIPQ